MNRKIFLDTETTGLSFKEGHKIIEIAAMEMIDRKLTGNNFHSYINPKRKIDQGAMKIHKIQNAFLLDKPIFSSIADDFLKFIKDSTLIIHNSSFDLGFLDNEISMLYNKFEGIEKSNKIIDSLELARNKYYGQKNSLDALCKRFSIDYTERQKKGHGALLDCRILYEVYICMTSQQMTFNLSQNIKKIDFIDSLDVKKSNKPLVVIKANEKEVYNHDNFFVHFRNNN